MQHNFIGVIELCGRKRRILLHPVLIIIPFYCLVHNIASNTADRIPCLWNGDKLYERLPERVIAIWIKYLTKFEKNLYLYFCCAQLFVCLWRLVIGL